jgi:type VI secretion system secreted protein Hcp
MDQIKYFLKIEGIEGDSQDPEHKGEIDLLAWSWYQSQGGVYAAGGGGGAGKVNMEDFHFDMTVNKASPRLFVACATGEHIRKAVLTCRKVNKKYKEYLKIILTDLLVSSYQIDGQFQQITEEVHVDRKETSTKAGHNQIGPKTHVTLNFARIEIEYNEQKEDGSASGMVKAGWDLKANKAV